MIAFGPIPSRRLGRSLGINNIPPKICSYSCIYCQLGKTRNTSTVRREFYTCDEIFLAVKDKVEKVKKHGEHIDYLSFVPDGEPTLDINIGKEIDMLKSLDIKIAVFTNSSLLPDKNVRDALMKADLVSVKIDTDNEDIWKRINEPEKSTDFSSVLKSLMLFRKAYKGKIVTETMLIKDVNDKLHDIEKLAGHIASIDPDIAYILVPTRPPAVSTVKAPEKAVIAKCLNIFSRNIDYVECLTDYEGNLFGFTGNVEMDILSITSVHPMRKDGVKEILKKANKSWSIIDNLINQGKLREIEYDDNKYYARNFNYRF